MGSPANGERDDPCPGRARHDSAIGAILLTGAGEQAFCSGATSAFVATTATATRRAPITSTCWISSVTLHLPCRLSPCGGLRHWRWPRAAHDGDLTIAADNAVSATAPGGSFDTWALHGESSARKAREIWFVPTVQPPRRWRWAMNHVVPVAELERERALVP